MHKASLKAQNVQNMDRLLVYSINREHKTTYYIVYSISQIDEIILLSLTHTYHIILD